jgi:hypothetical protein
VATRLEKAHKRYLVRYEDRNLGILVRALFVSWNPEGGCVYQDRLPIRGSDRRGDCLAIVAVFDADVAARIIAVLRTSRDQIATSSSASPSYSPRRHALLIFFAT